MSHCPTNVGLRLLPFTGWRHLTLCISCPAQDKALCDSPTPPHFMGGQLHGQTGLVCAPRGEANLLGWTRSHQAGEARKKPSLLARRPPPPPSRWCPRPTLAPLQNTFLYTNTKKISQLLYPLRLTKTFTNLFFPLNFYCKLSLFYFSLFFVDTFRMQIGVGS